MEGPSLNERERSRLGQAGAASGWLQRNSVLMWGMGAGIVFWLLESTVHCTIFDEGGFSNCLLPTDPNELWMRSFIVVMFVSFGYTAQGLNDRRVRAESRRGDEQFRTLVDASPEAVVVHQDGCVVYANHAAGTLFGAAGVRELIGSKILDFVHPDFHSVVGERIRQAGAGEELTPYLRERLVRLDGGTFMAEVNAMVAQFDGKTAVMALIRDIEEQHRWEEALKASLQQAEAACDEAEVAHRQVQEQARLLELFYQHSHDCIVLLDREFNFIRVNQAYANVCQRSVEDFPGHNHFEFYPSPLVEEFREVVATGRPYKINARPFVFPDHPEWGETYWDLSLVPIPDAEGCVQLLLFTLKDVTQRQRAELGLRCYDEKIQLTLEATVRAVALAMEKRDPYTAGHQQRVSDIAVAIAEDLNLSEESIKGIRLGGVIHDIGKIYVPSELLSRPGKLRDAEYEIIKTHAQVGYDIIKGVDFPWPVAEVVYQHHERMDGSGYPQGLKGDAIAPEARIMAVADVLEAMVSHRPYRPAQGIRLATDELKRNRGVLYDPVVIDSCLKLIGNGRISPADWTDNKPMEIPPEP